MCSYNIKLLQTKINGIYKIEHIQCIHKRKYLTLAFFMALKCDKKYNTHLLRCGKSAIISTKHKPIIKIFYKNASFPSCSCSTQGNSAASDKDTHFDEVSTSFFVTLFSKELDSFIRKLVFCRD